ncbi:Phosphate transport system permease protein PstC [Commensalibacter sp. Nvir]|uniref:phosphate ABC transporter permease subunit PstC n=1 Tax=Commensalibacter sp. Nvir TaxID=3069817 RepID=UPI002D4AEBCE|nr:Phosphate transport system permease protein PstC [Commensalibacter sp. Nvir]
MVFKKLKCFVKRNVASIVFSGWVWGCGVFVLLIFLELIFELFFQGRRAFFTFGTDFFIRSVWNPVNQEYSARAALIGTLVTSIIGVAVALPLSFGCAYSLTELLPSKISQCLTVAIRLLAAVPSIIFGMWGFFILVPLMSDYVQPFLKTTLGTMPYIGALFSGGTFGVGMLTAGLILAIMITPYTTAVMQDAFANVPALLKESAYSLGATQWEVMRRVVLPRLQKIIIGGIVLGWGRALGETMAVTFVIGNAHHIGWSLFMPSNTIASLIALEFPESASEGLRMSSLMALGAILMLISFIVLFCAQWLLKRAVKN